MKKVLLVFAGFCFFTGSVWAQQITRIAVVDLPKIYEAFFRVSRVARELDERNARVQAEIDRMSREIQEIRARRVDAISEGDQVLAMQLETEIQQKSEVLREFHRERTAELEEQWRRASQSDAFLEQVFNEIRHVAESEGFSMVLRLNTEIVWYSPTVDITDRVIQSLLNRAQR